MFVHLHKMLFWLILITPFMRVINATSYHPNACKMYPVDLFIKFCVDMTSIIYSYAVLLNRVLLKLYFMICELKQELWNNIIIFNYTLYISASLSFYFIWSTFEKWLPNIQNWLKSAYLLKELINLIFTIQNVDFYKYL